MRAAGGLLPLLAAAAAAARAGGADQTVTVTSSGSARTSILHLPPLPPSPKRVPLVVNLHTLAESGKQEATLSGMSTLADTEGFIVAYPNGLAGSGLVGKSWNAGACCPKACAEKVPDTQFIVDLVAYVKANVATLSGGKLTVDADRVYGTGGSNGAFMINRVGCEAPLLFAAIAPVAGPIINGSSPTGKSDPYPCPMPPKPLPTLYFQGTSDPLVPWGGNKAMGFPSIDSYISLRKTLNGVKGDSPGTASYARGDVECTTYGAAATNVTLCKHSKGHCWPGHEAQGPCTMNIDATAQMWEFFKRYTFTGA